MNIYWDKKKDISYLENFFLCKSIATYFNIQEMFEVNGEDIEINKMKSNKYFKNGDYHLKSIVFNNNSNF